MAGLLSIQLEPDHLTGEMLAWYAYYDKELTEEEMCMWQDKSWEDYLSASLDGQDKDIEFKQPHNIQNRLAINANLKRYFVGV